MIENTNIYIRRELSRQFEANLGNIPVLLDDLSFHSFGREAERDIDQEFDASGIHIDRSVYKGIFVIYISNYSVGNHFNWPTDDSDIISQEFGLEPESWKSFVVVSTDDLTSPEYEKPDFQLIGMNGDMA